MTKALILLERVQAMFRCVFICSNPLPIFFNKKTATLVDKSSGHIQKFDQPHKF